jgi:hypothetical protein
MTDSPRSQTASRSAVRALHAVLLAALLAPALALGAAKGAHTPRTPEPEPLNAFKPEEAKKDDKAAPAGASTPSAAPADAASATTPAALPAAGATSASAGAAPAAPSGTNAVAAPPAAATAPTAPAAPAALPPASPRQPDPLTAFMHDITITDIVIALFAIIVALFAWRVSRATAGVGASTQGQLDANRRAIEASERAAEAAKRSAEAAERSAVVLQETAARQLRPYVTVKEFLQGPVKDENNFLHGWVFQVVWQNSGATPTRGFRYWAALRQFDHDIPQDFDFAPPVMADFAGGELGSHSTVTSGTLFVPQTDVVLIQNGSRKAVLYGKAEYQDVLGGDARRETRFAVEVVLVADPGGAAGTPFSFSYFPRHNAIT